MNKDVRNLGDRYKEVYAGAERHQSDQYDTQLTDIVKWLRDKGFYLRDKSFGYRDPVYNSDEPAFFYIGYNAETQEFYGDSDRDATLYQGPEGVLIHVILTHVTTDRKRNLAPQLSVEVKKFAEWKLPGHQYKTIRQNSFQTVFHKSLYMWSDDTQWKGIDELLNYAWEQWERTVEQMRSGDLDDFDF